MMRWNWELAIVFLTCVLFWVALIRGVVHWIVH